MTLDALYQLLKTVLPPDTDSADDLQDFMAMLMAKKHHSEALSPFRSAYTCCPLPIATLSKRLR